jgi:ParB/RepB/Spo0J family partition protein
MNNKTKKSMMSRFLQDDLPDVSPAVQAPSPASGKSLSGMDILNKAMGVLSTDGGQQSAEIRTIGIESRNKRSLSPAEFHRLKASIESDGLFNPITVRKSDDPRFVYMVVAGHNRLQVMTELGRTTVPINVVDLKDDGSKAAFISNLLQPELGIAEIFEGLKILRAGEGEQKSVRQLSTETGFSTAYISQVLSMEQLPTEVILSMKRARVRVGSNALKSFVKLFADSNEGALQKLTSETLSMIEETFSSLVALSPTLSTTDDLNKGAGEDSTSKTWQQALSTFVASHSGKTAGKKIDSPKRKLDLRGWSLTEVNRRKNSVVLSFESEEDAALFLKEYQSSQKA